MYPRALTRRLTAGGLNDMTGRPGRMRRLMAWPVVALTLLLVQLTAVGGADVASSLDDPGGSFPIAEPVEPLPLTPAMAARLEDRPNIVLITTDDMATTDLAHMPYTRRLLTNGGVSLEGISPHPLCCPARAEILTGQYAQNNGVRSNRGPYGGFRALRPRNTIATSLQSAGYETIFMGKFLNGYSGRFQTGQMPGWTSWNPTLRGVYRYNNFWVANDGVAVQMTNTYQTDYFTDLAERKIALGAASERPFFLWQSYVAPHVSSHDDLESPQWSPPPPALRHRTTPYEGLPASMSDPSYAEANIRDKPLHMRNLTWDQTAEQSMIELNRARVGSLQSVDEGIRDMVAALRVSGELDNTLIIFTSDNGYLLGEHRFHGKVLPYEPSLSVPLIMRGPGIPTGLSRDRIGTTIDLAPTILSAAGATPVLRMDGRDLLPVVRRGTPSGRTVLIQAGPRNAADDPYGWFYRGVRDRRWTYVRYRTGELELYDRVEDPHQLQNLASKRRYEPVVAELARRLTVLETCAGNSCRRDLGPPPAPR